MKHNPVLNGTTKTVVISSTVFVGTLTLAAMLCLVVPMSLAGLSFWDLFAMKSIFGGIATGGMSIFRRLINKFMDTRSYHEKHKDDLEKIKLKNAKYKMKLDYKIKKKNRR